MSLSPLQPTLWISKNDNCFGYLLIHCDLFSLKDLWAKTQKDDG